MPVDLDDILREFSGNAGASEQAISAAEQVLGRRLPEDFREFLRATNGGEGFVGENYVMMFTAEEIVAYHEKYEVERYVPGMLLIGSSGGGEAYALDYRGSCRPSVVRVPFVGMSSDYAVKVAEDFGNFLERLAAGNVP